MTGKARQPEVPQDGKPHWPWTRRCGKCKGKGSVSRALLPGRRTCPRCDGEQIVATLLYVLAGRHADRRGS